MTQRVIPHANSRESTKIDNFLLPVVTTFNSVALSKISNHNCMQALQKQMSSTSLSFEQLEDCMRIILRGNRIPGNECLIEIFMIRANPLLFSQSQWIYCNICAGMCRYLLFADERWDFMSPCSDFLISSALSKNKIICDDARFSRRSELQVLFWGYCRIERKFAFRY